MNITPIKTELDYQNSLARIELLWDAQINTPEGDELDVLATLVSAYEKIHFFIEAPDPVKAIEFRMEQQGLNPNDLVAYLGQRSRVTEILNYQRKLSLNMIRRLSIGLNIPLESLIKDYELTNGKQHSSSECN